ncbi:hypothetical protein [Pseudorhodobacter antarcticus]|uniref:hypothetical protein n=1 Tax=Pseudorhodobacter antarcticus TaxID=1077947 RepID=UPI000B0B0E10|nr:hypothetical protein [Pseudorhodobacter antarcticus]
MDLSKIHSVTKSYSWKGEFIGYVAVDSGTAQQMWIPLDEGNYHYQAVVKAVQDGACHINEPLFTFFYSVLGKSKKVVGYNTNLGFVPADDQNALYVLLLKVIAERTAENRGSAAKGDIPRCTHLKFCLFFPRPWPHLSGPFFCNWSYNLSKDSNPVTCLITLSNHPENPSNPIHAAITSLGIENLQVATSALLLQHAMLEIDFDIDDLWRLFKAERKAGFGSNSDFIDDQVEQGRIRFDCKKGTPDTRVLLQVAPQFLRRAVADIANDVAQAFNREYGGYSVGFIREPNLQEQFLCLLHNNGDEHHLWQFGQQSGHSFNLSGEWHRRGPVAQSKTLSLGSVANRLRALIEAGFALEAIVVANAYNEVVCREIVAAIVSHDQGAMEWVLASTKFGYDRSRELLLNAIDCIPDASHKSELVAWLKNLASVYRHRNAYAHALKSINHELDKSVDTVREAEMLLRPLLDVFENGRLMGMIQQLLIGSEEIISHKAKTEMRYTQQLHH